MKKALALILAMLMCLSVMVSCGKPNNGDDPADTTTAAGGENTPADTTTTVAETESPYDVNGYLKDISLDRIPTFEARLYEFMDNRHAAVLDAIRATGKLESDTEEALKAALTELLKEFTVTE